MPQATHKRAVVDEFFTDYTLRTVALGAGTLGIVSGALGSYAVLRKQSLLGDALSHAALPGVALAFILTGSKGQLALMLGAAIAGWIATLFVAQITRHTRIKQDTALGLVLSVFFGFGLMLLTFIQQRADASQAGLDRFLFGQAAALLESDVITMAAVGGLALSLMLIFWKELKLLSFDPDFAVTIGFQVRALDILLTTLLVIAIVVGLQTVGVVLMSAMVVAPAVAARQWTDKLAVMVGAAAFFGAISGVVGAYISSQEENLPTGPAIVICITCIALLSLALAPNRGLVWARVRQWRNARGLRSDAVLADLLALAQQHEEEAHGHSIEVLTAMRPGQGSVSKTLRHLASEGLAGSNHEGEWSLTSRGLAEAKRLTSQEQEPS